MSQTYIDWTEFSQGPVSDDMWSAFKQLVFWSHEYSKHKNAAHEDRRNARVRDPSSARSARRIERQWEASARTNDDKWHEAEFEAHRVLNRIAKIGNDSGPENPDWRFSIATIKAVGSLLEQKNCDFSVTAIHRIDVGKFLEVPAVPGPRTFAGTAASQGIISREARPAASARASGRRASSRRAEPRHARADGPRCGPRRNCRGPRASASARASRRASWRRRSDRSIVGHRYHEAGASPDDEGGTQIPHGLNRRFRRIALSGNSERATPRLHGVFPVEIEDER